jgi:hypothetical protein
MGSHESDLVKGWSNYPIYTTLDLTAVLTSSGDRPEVSLCAFSAGSAGASGDLRFGKQQQQVPVSIQLWAAKQSWIKGFGIRC